LEKLKEEINRRP